MISADIDELNIEELRTRLSEAEHNLMAIYSGEIDALMLTDEKGERRVFALKSADAPYRALVERMQEGAATLSITGDIVYCNQRFADLVRMPLEQVFGASIGRFLRGWTRALPPSGSTRSPMPAVRTSEHSS